MTTIATPIGHEAAYPIRLRVEPALEGRNRLTTAFRIVLAIPHLILVGGPIAAILSWTSRAPADAGVRYDWGGGEPAANVDTSAAGAAAVQASATVFAGVDGLCALDP